MGGLGVSDIYLSFEWVGVSAIRQIVSLVQTCGSFFKVFEPTYMTVTCAKRYLEAKQLKTHVIHLDWGRWYSFLHLTSTWEQVIKTLVSAQVDIVLFCCFLFFPH